MGMQGRQAPELKGRSIGQEVDWPGDTRLVGWSGIPASRQLI